MDWFGQLDNLTKLVIFVIVGLGIAVGSLVFTNREKDSTIWWQERQINDLESRVEAITAEHNRLWSHVDAVIAQMDAHDPAGPARQVIEELRRLRP